LTSDQALIEERQVLLSVLLELTDAASALFDPNVPISYFLEKLAERLGCVVVLCLEVTIGRPVQVQLLDSIGLSHDSKERIIPHIDCYCSLEDLDELIQWVQRVFPYSELRQPGLVSWNFPILISEVDFGLETAYFLQVYFDENVYLKPQYNGMIEKLLVNLKSVLVHRKLYKKTLEQKLLLDDLLKKEMQARSDAEAEREKIQKALGIRDDFISFASHELRTPITSLKMALQLAENELKTHEQIELTQLKKVIHIASNQVERLTRLIFGLLDVSKIQAGKLSIEKSRVNLSSLLAEIVHRFGEQFEVSRINVKLNIEPDIYGHWDPFRIEQVINNLIENAIKYGASQPIDISLRLKEGVAYLVVRDRGIGIKKDQRKKVFEKYMRIGSSAKVTGLGLGLYIVSQIVKSHGGSIRVIGAPGKGSSFIVQLPIQ
jgi:signal transduction histidine kinase